MSQACHLATESLRGLITSIALNYQRFVDVIEYEELVLTNDTLEKVKCYLFGLSSLKFCFSYCEMTQLCIHRARLLHIPRKCLTSDPEVGTAMFFTADTLAGSGLIPWGNTWCAM